MILSVLSSPALVSGLMVVRAKNPVHSVLNSFLSCLASIAKLGECRECSGTGTAEMKLKKDLVIQLLLSASFSFRVASCMSSTITLFIIRFSRLSSHQIPVRRDPVKAE